MEKNKAPTLFELSEVCSQNHAKATHSPYTTTEDVLEVHHRLCQLYGCPVAYFHELDPLSELISSLLSHRTKNIDSGRAFRSLRAVFPSWEAVRDSPLAPVEHAIAAVTWPEQKAPRIQKILRTITRQRGNLDLGFLSTLTVSAAREWLESLPGVGPKTSAAVLLFSCLHRPALPVDAHHFRVAQRLGWIGEISEARAHRVLESRLPSNWSAQQMYDHHEVMMFHGQQCCYHRNPACARCPVANLCEWRKSQSDLSNRLKQRSP